MRIETQLYIVCWDIPPSIPCTTHFFLNRLDTGTFSSRKVPGHSFFQTSARQISRWFFYKSRKLPSPVVCICRFNGVIIDGLFTSIPCGHIGAFSDTFCVKAASSLPRVFGRIAIEVIKQSKISSSVVIVWHVPYYKFSDEPTTNCDLQGFNLFYI